MTITTYTTNIIIFILALLIIIYIYNDFIYPLIYPSIAQVIEPYISNFPYLQKYFPNNTNTLHSNIEQFSQYNKTSLENTTQFDTNWYLRDPNKPIISSNHISLPVIR